WIKFCQEHHTRNYTVVGATSVQGLQVVDCHANIVVPATHHTEYLALSYVWGVHTTVEALEGHKLLWAKLPQTVRDAISTTIRLGYRYVWVDRYCIPTDPKLKHAQIMNMDIIYRQAIATIVAAAGKDADFGLVGASVRSRLEQPLAKVGKYTLFSTLAHPRSTIANSVWASRGWTYQEALLSKRKIFFLEDQVYYECDGMQCCE
ncbi:heterokaryon incompatibility protein-domain-containing protein, partial [Pyrenochaeta sp. MPI-SDFR-AT-0127]